MPIDLAREPIVAEHVDTQCDHCGKVDNHPKSHWNSGETFHFDCLPHGKKSEFIESHPLAKALVDAAESGRRGEDLRSFSNQLHSDYAAQNAEA
jgi:hypothetical protein